MTGLARICWMFVAIIAGAGSAAAQSCTVSLDQMNFGTVRLAELAARGTVVTLTADCLGQTGETIRLCPTVAGGLLNHAQDAAFHLRLNLFADPSHAVPLQSGLDIPLIGAAGSGHATVTVYGVVTPYSGSFKGGIYHAAVHLGLVGSYLSAGPPLCSALVGSVQRAVPSVRTHVKAVAAKR